MIVSRMQILTLLSIFILIGSMANNANGVCYRPNFTNPYAILLNPDQQTYNEFFNIEYSCIEEHTGFGLPEVIYCMDPLWDIDTSEGRCEAQCSTIDLLDDDIVVTVNSSQQTLVDSQTTAQFACRDPGQFTGLISAICTNGTFDFDGSAEPSCLAYCPIYLQDFGEGLSYDDATNLPVEDIGNDTVKYYRNENSIIYECNDGYDELNCTLHNLPDCTSDCVDGKWDPPNIPTCMEIDECSDNPCQNNATCIDLINEYQCQCADGFNGSNCENNIDDCANHMCENGATCVDEIDSYECQCPDGFNGIHCENATMTTEASTTEGLSTSLPNSTPPSTTPMTPIDSSTTSVVTNGMVSTTVVDDMTTATSGVTIVSPDATTVIPDATSITPGLTTVIPDGTTVTPDTTTVGSGVTTVTPAISTETAPLTVPESTTKSDSTTSLTSTASLPETTETESVRMTSPDDSTEPSPTESKETTASQKTSPKTPERTEKPPTTPLPCGGECKATQVCNAADNKCECRPDYYEDEKDTEKPCKEPESIDVTIKITKVNDTDAEYKDELEDPSSPEFKKLEIDVCEPFNEIYENDLEYKGCRVLEFRNGSIIVNYALTFAENSNQSTSTVNKTVQQELQNPNGSFTGDYEFDDSSLVVTPLDECTKEIDDCDENAICIDQIENGYTCECREGYDDVGIPKSLPGRECMKPTEPQPTEPQPTDPGTTKEPEEPGLATEPQPTEPQPTDPRTTKEPEEPGLEPWKVVVGVTVPIISILTIAIVGLTCWQYRRLHRTSPSSAMSKMRTFPYDEDTGGSSDHEASRPGSMMIMNNDGTVQEVVLPWRNIPPEEEFIFAPDNNAKGRTQMLPMVDYPNDYAASASYENDPLGNIVDSYDNYTYQHHDTRNSTEIDSKYF